MSLSLACAALAGALVAALAGVWDPAAVTGADDERNTAEGAACDAPAAPPTLSALHTKSVYAALTSGTAEGGMLLLSAETLHPLASAGDATKSLTAADLSAVEGELRVSGVERVRVADDGASLAFKGDAIVCGVACEVKAAVEHRGDAMRYFVVARPASEGTLAAAGAEVVGDGDAAMTAECVAMASAAPSSAGGNGGAAMLVLTNVADATLGDALTATDAIATEAAADASNGLSDATTDAESIVNAPPARGVALRRGLVALHASQLGEYVRLRSLVSADDAGADSRRALLSEDDSDSDEDGGVLPIDPKTGLQKLLAVSDLHLTATADQGIVVTAGIDGKQVAHYGSAGEPPLVFGGGAVRVDSLDLHEEGGALSGNVTLTLFNSSGADGGKQYGGLAVGGRADDSSFDLWAAANLALLGDANVSVSSVRSAGGTTTAARLTGSITFGGTCEMRYDLGLPAQAESVSLSGCELAEGITLANFTAGLEGSKVVLSGDLLVHTGLQDAPLAFAVDAAYDTDEKDATLSGSLKSSVEMLPGVTLTSGSISCESADMRCDITGAAFTASGASLALTADVGAGRAFELRASATSVPLTELAAAIESDSTLSGDVGAVDWLAGATLESAQLNVTASPALRVSVAATVTDSSSGEAFSFSASSTFHSADGALRLTMAGATSLGARARIANWTVTAARGSGVSASGALVVDAGSSAMVVDLTGKVDTSSDGDELALNGALRAPWTASAGTKTDGAACSLTVASASASLNAPLSSPKDSSGALALSGALCGVHADMSLALPMAEATESLAISADRVQVSPVLALVNAQLSLTDSAAAGFSATCSATASVNSSALLADVALTGSLTPDSFTLEGTLDGAASVASFAVQSAAVSLRVAHGDTHFSASGNVTIAGIALTAEVDLDKVGNASMAESVDLAADGDIRLSRNLVVRALDLSVDAGGTDAAVTGDATAVLTLGKHVSTYAASVAFGPGEGVWSVTAAADAGSADADSPSDDGDSSSAPSGAAHAARRLLSGDDDAPCDSTSAAAVPLAAIGAASLDTFCLMVSRTASGEVTLGAAATLLGRAGAQSEWQLAAQLDKADADGVAGDGGDGRSVSRTARLTLTASRNETVGAIVAGLMGDGALAAASAEATLEADITLGDGGDDTFMVELSKPQAASAGTLASAAGGDAAFIARLPQPLQSAMAAPMLHATLSVETSPVAPLTLAAEVSFMAFALSDPVSARVAVSRPSAGAAWDFTLVVAIEAGFDAADVLGAEGCPDGVPAAESGRLLVTSGDHDLACGAVAVPLTGGGVGVCFNASASDPGLGGLSGSLASDDLALAGAFDIGTKTLTLLAAVETDFHRPDLHAGEATLNLTTAPRVFELSIAAQAEATVGKASHRTNLTFGAEIDVSKTGLSIAGEVDGWAEPFGMRGVSLDYLAVGIDVEFASADVSMEASAGATVGDSSGDATVIFDFSQLSGVLAGDLDDFDLGTAVAKLTHGHSPDGLVSTLDGFDFQGVSFAASNMDTPVTFHDVTYRPGFDLAIESFELWGKVHGAMSLHVHPTRVAANASLSPVTLGPLTIEGYSDASAPATLALCVGSGCGYLTISGRAELFGASAGVSANISDAGWDVQAEVSLGSLFDVTLHLTSGDTAGVKDFGFDFELRMALLSSLGGDLTTFLRNESSALQRSVGKAEEKYADWLAAKQPRLDDINAQILALQAQHEATLTAEEAKLAKLHDKAATHYDKEQALKEQKAELKAERKATHGLAKKAKLDVQIAALDVQIAAQAAAAAIDNATYTAELAVAKVLTKLDPQVGVLKVERAGIWAGNETHKARIAAAKELQAASVDLSKIASDKIFSIESIAISGGSLSDAQGGGGVSASVTGVFFGKEKTFSTSFHLRSSGDGSSAHSSLLSSVQSWAYDHFHHKEHH